MVGLTGVGFDVGVEIITNDTAFFLPGELVIGSGGLAAQLAEMRVFLKLSCLSAVIVAGVE